MEKFIMYEYLKANQKLWNEWTGEHEKSPFYDVEGFKAGRQRLKSIELEVVGDVREKKYSTCSVTSG
jgi:hypothetical protein